MNIKCTENVQISAEDIGQIVRYYAPNGWHTGKLVDIQKKLAIISTPIPGQRKKKIPLEDVERMK